MEGFIQSILGSLYELCDKGQPF